MKKIIVTLCSVATLLLLCKPVLADENIAEEKSILEKSILDNFILGGYSSVGLVIPREGSTQAAVNEFSLILRWESDSRFKFFGEFELERPLIWNDGHGLTTRDAYFDLERLYIDYNLTEKLNLRAGRFLNPAGRWNLLHAAPLVWTSTRPLATSRLFPTSVNGLMLFGSVPFEEQAFEYTFFIEALKDQIKDDNEILYKKVNGAYFAYNGLFANTTKIGLTLSTFTEDTPREPNYRMVGLDFVTHYNKLEFSGEAFQRLNNKNNDGGSGAYLQAAYEIGNNWFLLTRAETFDRPDTGSAERWLIGATKRLKPNQLLKFEWVGGSGENPDSPRGFVGSFAILF